MRPPSSVQPAGEAMSRKRACLRAGLRIAACAIVLLPIAAFAACRGWIHLPRPDPAERALFQGVSYAREVAGAPRPLVAHVVTVDLQAPGVRLLVTPGDPTLPRPLAARTTSEFLSEFHVQVAVNGDFFDPWYSNSPWD